MPRAFIASAVAITALRSAVARSIVAGARASLSGNALRKQRAAMPRSRDPAGARRRAR